MSQQLNFEVSCSACNLAELSLQGHAHAKHQCLCSPRQALRHAPLGSLCSLPALLNVVTDILETSSFGPASHAACRCLLDHKPRRFDAHDCLILCMFAELAMREIERSWRSHEVNI